MWIIKHQQEFWFLWVKLRRGRAEFPVCISATTPAECDCEHRAASCLCPQITLWGRIHVVGNSVPLLREKSPAGCLLCCTVRLTSKAGWKKFCGVEVYLMARLTNLLHLFIFLISLLATAVVTDDCRGLGGGILEFCWFGWWLLEQVDWIFSVHVGSARRDANSQSSSGEHGNYIVHVLYFISLSFSVSTWPSDGHLSVYTCAEINLSVHFSISIHTPSLHSSRVSLRCFSLSVCLSLFQIFLFFPPVSSLLPHSAFPFQLFTKCSYAEHLKISEDINNN